jgi:hypothetical protein
MEMADFDVSEHLDDFMKKFERDVVMKQVQ